MPKVGHGRVRPPVYSPPGSLYDAVRRILTESGGACTRAQLERHIVARSDLRARMVKGGGLGALLSNMRHSGEVTVDGDYVQATARAMRRMQLRRRDGHEA